VELTLARNRQSRAAVEGFRPQIDSQQEFNRDVHPEAGAAKIATVSNDVVNA
jgi:hypothetical protein